MDTGTLLYLICLHITHKSLRVISHGCAFRDLHTQKSTVRNLTFSKLTIINLILKTFHIKTSNMHNVHIMSNMRITLKTQGFVGCGLV